MLHAVAHPKLSTTDSQWKVLDELTAQVPEIKPGARYWFFRTAGVDLFRPFVGSGSIAFGYPRVTLKTLHGLPKENYLGHLKDLVAKLYPDNKTPGLAASQLLRFVSEMKPGIMFLSHRRGPRRLLSVRFRSANLLKRF
jgi:hypothetical protein